jgi:SSS family solute:Na+ symporter
MPLLVVLPGIAAYVLYQQGELQQQMLTNGEFREDNAYSAVLGFLPTGLRGLSMAALTAAIVASLAGKANSISTIFTLDIYKKYFNKESTEKRMVWIGRAMVIAALFIAIIVNWNDALGIGGRGGFEFIQKYTGYISPAIFPVFLLGFFWKKTTSKGAIAGIVGGLLLAILFDRFLPGITGRDTWMYTAYANNAGVFEIPFLVQMGWVFFLTFLLIIGVSLLDQKGRAHVHALEVDKSMYKVSKTHLAMIVIVLMLTIAIYVRFW